MSEMYRDNAKKYTYYNAQTDQDLQRKWWRIEDTRMHESIWPLINGIMQSQGTRHKSNHQFYRMYQNQSTDGMSAARQLNSFAHYFGAQTRTTFNVIKSCIDTARSKIVKQKPRPFFLTENGNWHLQKKAERLNQFMLALFDQMGTQNGLIRESLYTIGSDVFFDAAITGTGAARMGIKGNRVYCERFLSDELIVDQFEGIYRTPRSLHQIKYIDREVLLDIYPEAEFRKLILDARSAVTNQLQGSQDMIPVIESYHLRSGKEAKDGCRAVTIETGTLFKGSWDKEYFPYLIQRWSQRPIGFFGIGLAEELQGIQREINHLLSLIQTGLKRVAIPRVYWHIGDHKSRKTMSNEIGEHHFYREKPPFVNTPQAFNSETYMHLDRLFGKAFELSGISQLGATSRKPSGLNSGVALREYQDIESERFATVHLMYENFFTPQATYMVLDMLDDLLESGHDTIVQSKDGITQQRIKYSDVRIPQDSFTVRPYPTNFLPSEPAGKFAKVQELVEAGLYDVEEARELLDFPDIKKTNRVKTAVRNACISQIERIIDTGEYQPVEPYQDIQLTQKLAQHYYLEGRNNGMPEDRLALLQTLLTECRVRIEEIAASQMAQQEEQMMRMQQMQAASAGQGELVQ